jgi:tRNA A37 N6-isopentenylltransferase MiaA
MITPELRAEIEARYKKETGEKIIPEIGYRKLTDWLMEKYIEHAKAFCEIKEQVEEIRDHAKLFPRQ